MSGEVATVKSGRLRAAFSWLGRPDVEERQDVALSFDAWVDMLTNFSYQGVQYTLPGARQEEIGGNFTSLTRQAYKSNGVVFACMLVRSLLFSEARYQLRTYQNGRPGKLFGSQDLAPIETPWPGGTTGDLLTKALTYADLAGNAFMVARQGGIRMLRPDWVTIVIGSQSNADVTAWDPDSEVIGYVYKPGGPGSDRPEVRFLADEVAHFAPVPDPEAQFRGMSWVTPVIREVMADKAATQHKLAFFENGATVNLAVKMDTPDIEKARPWIEMFQRDHQGSRNAYKTIFMGAGADITPVGTNFQELELRATQGAMETRIASASGVPPVIVGLSEGLAAATYSNYSQSMRRFADLTMRPLWRNFAGSLANIITVPGGAELWYDDRDIPALQEDRGEQAAIQMQEASAIKTLVDAGFESDSVVAAILANDFNLLSHSGLFSVQLQPAGSVGQGKGALLGGVVVADPNAPAATPVQQQPPPATNGKKPTRSVKRVEFSDGRTALVTTLES